MLASIFYISVKTIQKIIGPLLPFCFDGSRASSNFEILAVIPMKEAIDRYSFPSKYGMKETDILWKSLTSDCLTALLPDASNCYI